jgi:ribosome-binding factor A
MSNRTDRVANSIKEELAWMIEKGEIKDPRIGFVTITEVDVTADLRHARAYFSHMGGKREREQALAGLNSAAGFVRTELGHRLRLKHVPELEFKYDPTVETGARISKLLHDIHLKETESDD